MTRPNDHFERVLWTPAQMSRALQIPLTELVTAAHRGEFPQPIIVAGRWRWRRSDVTTWINRWSNSSSQDVERDGHHA